MKEGGKDREKKNESIRGRRSGVELTCYSVVLLRQRER